MTQEEKDLLLKDLCGRLPYGIKCATVRYRPDEKFIISTDTITFENISKYTDARYKIYLFPLSSMTDEQKEYIRNRFCYEWEGDPYEIWRHEIDIVDADELIDWFNENHFDYRGLIPKNLAIDATNKNIY